MDAAVDAVHPLGYPKDLIRKSVKHLLKVYCEEWSFIEEASYKVLIEYILDEQSKQEHDSENQEGEHYLLPQEKGKVSSHRGESSSNKDVEKKRKPCYGWISDEDLDDMFDAEERAANRC